MNKKRLGALSVLTALALAAAGLTAPAQAATKTLVVWASADKATALKKVAAPWAAANKVTLNVVSKDFGKIRDELITAGPKGLGPDVIIGAHDWLGSLVASGALDRINVNRGNFGQSPLEAMSVKGLVYGVPFGVENIGLVVNNKLAATPKTFAEMETTWATLKAAKTATVGLAIGKGDFYHHYPLMTGLGGYVFGWKNNAWSTRDIGIASKNFIANAPKIDAWYASGFLNGNTNQDAWFAGKAPYMLTGPWNAAKIKAVDFSWSIIPMPSPGSSVSRPFMGVQGMFLSKFAKNKVVARDFLVNYVQNEEFQVAYYKEVGLAPANLAGQANPIVQADKVLSGLAAWSSVAQPMPNIPQMGSVWGDAGNAWTTIADGKAKAADAFTLAATNIKKAIG